MTPQRATGYQDILDALPDDAARAAQCRAWFRQAQHRWFQGQQESVQDVLDSRDIRYNHMDAATRRTVGKQKWSTSPTMKSIAGDAEMFASWAIMYGVAKP